MDREILNTVLVDINKFIELSEQALEADLSDSGKQDQDNGKLEGYKNFWKKMLEETRQKKEEYIFVLENQDSNSEDITKSLRYFNSLARYVEECSCTWSSKYREVDEALDKLCVDLDKWEA